MSNRYPKGISRHDSKHGAGLPKQPKMIGRHPQGHGRRHWLNVIGHLQEHNPNDRQGMRKAKKMLGRYFS